MISHNALLFNRNVHMCANFCYKMVHCGIYALWDFVRYLLWEDELANNKVISSLPTSHDLKLFNGCNAISFVICDTVIPGNQKIKQSDNRSFQYALPRCRPMKTISRIYAIGLVKMTSEWRVFFAHFWVILLYFSPESRLISGVFELGHVVLNIN